MDFAELLTLLAVCEVGQIAVSLDQVAVVDLPQFLVVDVLEEELHHLPVHLLLFLSHLSFALVLGLGTVDNIRQTHVLFFGHQGLIPANEEVIPVEVGTTDLCSQRDLALLREYHAVQQFDELVGHLFALESALYLFLAYALDNPDVGWVKARIPSDECILFDNLELLTLFFQ